MAKETKVIFKYCQSAFKKINVNIDFPKGADPEKTYLWKHTEKFTKRCNELKLTDIITKKIINKIVIIVHKRKLHRRGLTVLNDQKIFDEAVELVYQDEQRIKGMKEILNKNHALINSVDLNNTDGLPTIVQLYIDRKLSEYYIAVSKRCLESIRSLDDIDKRMLPEPKSLALSRIKISSDVHLKNYARHVLQDDCVRL